VQKFKFKYLDLDQLIVMRHLSFDPQKLMTSMDHTPCIMLTI